MAKFTLTIDDGVGQFEDTHADEVVGVVINGTFENPTLAPGTELPMSELTQAHQLGVLVMEYIQGLRADGCLKETENSNYEIDKI